MSATLAEFFRPQYRMHIKASPNTLSISDINDCMELGCRITYEAGKAIYSFGFAPKIAIELMVPDEKRSQIEIVCEQKKLWQVSVVSLNDLEDVLVVFRPNDD